MKDVKQWVNKQRTANTILSRQLCNWSAKPHQKTTIAGIFDPLVAIKYDETMSKLGCKCGHIIVDQRDCLPYKAAIIPDKSFYDFFGKIQEGIESLVEATKNGKRKEWIEENFAVPPYPINLTDAQMIADIFDRFYFDLRREMYQCEKCGRIWIQQPNSKLFVSFLPEVEHWKNILTKDDIRNQ